MDPDPFSVRPRSTGGTTGRSVRRYPGKGPFRGRVRSTGRDLSLDFTYSGKGQGEETRIGGGSSRDTRCLGWFRSKEGGPRESERLRKD